MTLKTQGGLPEDGRSFTNGIKAAAETLIFVSCTRSVV